MRWYILAYALLCLIDVSAEQPVWWAGNVLLALPVGWFLGRLP